MITKFIRGDGVEFECEVGSEAFKMMAKDGSFKRVYTEEEAAAQLAEAPAEAPAEAAEAPAEAAEAEPAAETVEDSRKDAKTQSKKK